VDGTATEVEESKPVETSESDYESSDEADEDEGSAYGDSPEPAALVAPAKPKRKAVNAPAACPHVIGPIAF
jgi:hypothetical protein